jgi:CBS domain-containing protein
MPRQVRVRDYMTTSPHFIGLTQTLAQAHKRMRELSVRHLPVLHGGVLRGILSERDIALVRALEVDPHEVTVEEAMSSEPYTVSAEMPLSRVARAMAAHKYGCAVAMEAGQVYGILTTTDALRALAEALEQQGEDETAMSPGQVRDVIRAEHVHIRGLLARAEAAAKDLLTSSSSDDDGLRPLRLAAQLLYASLTTHIELETRLLVPVLESADAWGRVRADGLRREHAEQTHALELGLKTLGDATLSPRALAEGVTRMVHMLRTDLELEEETLLNARVLQDLPAAATGES